MLPPFGKEGHWLAEAGEGAMMESIFASAAGLNVQAPVVQGASAKKR